MKKYETAAGIELTEEQCKLVSSFARLKIGRAHV